MDVKPTLNRAYIESIDDALKVVECVLSGYLHSVSRRPYEIERPKLICSGHIFVFIEEKSGIKRWTDGISWSPSRIVGKFLVYKELFKAPGQAATSPAGTGNGTDTDTGTVTGASSSYSYRSDGLIKKALSLRVHANPGELKEEDVEQALNQNVDHFTIHIISYYTLDDISNGILLTPSELEPFRGVVPSQRLLEALEMSSIGNNKTVGPPKFKHRDRPKLKSGGKAAVKAAATAKRRSPHVSTPILRQALGQPLGQAMGQPLGQPLGHTMGHTMSQPMSQSIGQSMGQSMGQFSSRPFSGSHTNPIVLMPPLSLTHQLPQQFGAAGSPSPSPYGIPFQYHQPFPFPCPNPQYPQEPYNSYLPTLPMPQPVLHPLPALAPYQTPHQGTAQGPGQSPGQYLASHRQLANTSASITISTSTSTSTSTNARPSLQSDKDHKPGPIPGPVSGPDSGSASGSASGPTPVKP